MARDKYHLIVKKALENEGWTITDDPLVVETIRRELKIDLGAERLLGAEKDSEKIAVEVKSFLNVSQVYAFYQALGQTIYYRVALEKTEPERVLFLAVPSGTYVNFFQEPITEEIIG